MKGAGKISKAGEVTVTLPGGAGTQKIATKNIVIATGSEPTPLPPVPVDNTAGKIVDSTGALVLKSVPAKMAVIGAGVIGLEMGSVWRRLGSEVTVIEYLDRITPSMDTETGTMFQRILTKQGFKFQLSTKVTKSEINAAGGVTLTTEPSKGGAPTSQTFDVVLVATGRRPFTAGLGLAELGVKQDKMGRVTVDHEFRTNIPGVFAIGDVIDGPMLAHKAEEEGIAAIETIKGTHGHVDYDTIPGVIYTYPEVRYVIRHTQSTRIAVRVWVDACEAWGARECARERASINVNTSEHAFTRSPYPACMHSHIYLPTLTLCLPGGVRRQDGGAVEGGGRQIREGRVPLRREQPRARNAGFGGAGQDPDGRSHGQDPGGAHYWTQRGGDDRR